MDGAEDTPEAATAIQTSSSSTEEVILPVPEQGGDGSQNISCERTTTPYFDADFSKPPIRSDELKKQEQRIAYALSNLQKKDSYEGKDSQFVGKSDIRKQRSFEKDSRDSSYSRSGKSDLHKNSKLSSSRKPPLTKTKDEKVRSDESNVPKLQRQASHDEPLPPEHPPVSRKSSGRGTRFLRSQPAVMDDSSPPATPDIAIHIQSEPYICWIPHQYSNEAPSFRLIKQPSNEARSEPALSREPSQEKEFTDSKGVNLHKFIVDTLQKPQDRTLLLKLEQELTDLVLSEENEKKFRPMTSYHRMIVHRVAAYFGLDHNVDHTGKSVIVNKTANTRIPEQKFREHIQDEVTEDGQPRRILTRNLDGGDDKDDDDRSDRSDFSGRDDKRSKSLEERQEEYEKARSRIFSQAQSGPVPEGLTVESLASTLKLKSILHSSSRQNSGGSDDSGYHWKQDRPWSSVDSSGSERPIAPAITKASSFAGSTISSNILMRTDSSASSRSSGSLGSIGKLHPSDPDRGSTSPHGPPRSLQISPFIYQPSLSTISQVPTSALQSNFQSAPTSVPVSPGYPIGPGGPVSWASSIPSSSVPSQCMSSVPSGGGHSNLSLPQPILFAAPNLESVPPGCIIINPQTGQPYLNADGTPLVYQPQNMNQQQQSESTQIYSQQPQLQPQQPGPHPNQQVNSPLVSHQPMGLQHSFQQPVVSQHSSVPVIGQYSHPIMEGHHHLGQVSPYSNQPVQAQQVVIQPQGSGDYQEIPVQMQNLTILQHQQPEGEYAYHQQSHNIPSMQQGQAVLTQGNMPQGVLMKQGQTYSAPPSMQGRPQVPTCPGVPSQQQVIAGNYGSQTQLAMTYQPQYKTTQLTPQLNLPGQQPSISQMPQISCQQQPTNNSNIHHHHVSVQPSSSVHGGAPMLISSDGHILSPHQPNQPVQTVYAQSYPLSSGGAPQTHTQVIYHIADHQSSVQPSLAVIQSNSQSSLQGSPMMTCNPPPPPPPSRDIVRPTSPNFQTVQAYPTTYVLPQQLMASNLISGQRPVGQGSHIVSGVPSSQGTVPSHSMLSHSMPQNILLSSSGMRSPLTESPSSAIRGKETYNPPPMMGVPQRAPSPVTAMPQHAVVMRPPGHIDKGIRSSLRGPRPHRAPRRQERLQHSDSMSLRASLEVMSAPPEVMEICKFRQDLSCQTAISLLEELFKFGAELRWLPLNPAIPFFTSAHVPKEDAVSNYTILVVFPSPELAQNAAASLISREYAFQVPEQECLSRLSGES